MAKTEKEKTKVVKMKKNNEKEVANAATPMWKVTDEFKNAAIGILSNHPFIQVSNLINIVNSMSTVPEADLNAVLSELGKLPYKEVADIILNAQTLCKLVK